MEDPLTDTPSETSVISPSKEATTADARRLDAYSLAARSDPCSAYNSSSHFKQYQTSSAQHNPSTGPRRGSFPDILPDGHTLPQPINGTPPTTEMPNPKPSPLEMPDLSHEELQTDSEPDLQSSGARPSMSVVPPPVSAAAQEIEGSTITVAVTAEAQASHHGSTTPSASITENIVSGRNRQYVLPDGSMISGKGLGRGRPGIKRGPRNLKHQLGEDASSQEPSMSETSGFSALGKPMSKKRKSGNSDGSTIMTQASRSGSGTTPSPESSEEYNPTAVYTRSGRQTQKRVSTTNTTAATASPPRRPTRTDTNVSTASASPATVKTHPKIKRRVYRGREQFALCEHCLRGHGPPGNVIVFCDACNKCWHQRCHDPVIPKQTVSDARAEWFCAQCDKILHGAKKGKKPPTKPGTIPLVAVPATNPPLAYTGLRVGGRLLDAAQKLAHLGTLSRDDLVSLLMEASNLAPDLPLFKPLMPVSQPTGYPQAELTSTYVTPVTKPPTFADMDTRANADTIDEGYDDYFDVHAALYPKPGNGVQLPQETEDLHMLLEAQGSKTFSHWVVGMGGRNFSGTGNIIS